MSPPRTPFHCGLFYNAMVGLLGREPDNRVCRGLDGFYDFRYIPQDDSEREKFIDASTMLAEWLDHFDITFSRSRCEFGRANPPQQKDPEMLQIRIQHPVAEK